MAEMPFDEFVTDHNATLLQLSLPDNEQTWLYCLHESDPNAIVDLSYFLSWDSALYDNCALVPPEDNTRSDHTFSLQKAQSTSEKRRTKLKHPNKKNTSCREDSSSIQENSNLFNTIRLPPIQSALLNQNCNNEDDSRLQLDDTNLIAQLTIDESLKSSAQKSVNSNQDTTLKNISNSWNISEHTLLANISAPKGFLDSTSISHRTSTDFSLFSKLNFNPNSVSTPTKKFKVCANTDEISITPDNINEPLINTNTEDKANDTYNVSLYNMESHDQNDSIHFNVTTTISNSNIETEKTSDVIEELIAKDTLQNTYIFEESTTDKSNANNTKIISNNENLISTEDNRNNKLDEQISNNENCISTEDNRNNKLVEPISNNENLISTEDNRNNKLDEPLNIPNADADFNSTITIKPKDNDDSEEDSCYSSSSNIRSLGDVCDMSQLQPQKNSNVDCTLTKTRSEDSLCLPEHACSSRKPKKHYGSALNLETHNINLLAADRKLHQNPNYFLRKPGNQVALPSVGLPENSVKYGNVEKAIIPTRMSKIPRPQSKIPKLISKK